MSSLIGRTLGQYEVVDRIGRGGMATVYLARQASIGRFVAIKVLPPHPALDDAFKERFQLEARTIGNLQNPNILPLYDYGTYEDVIYLVMQYVEGGTLEDLMDSGPMSVNQVEKIIRPIASGLDYAHSKGIVHRDIKPANILIQDGHPLLADFGMVKMAAGDSNLTGTAIVGTPSYMAPEQGQGLEIDQRVDVYALGAIAYEMLAGEQPFAGETPMQMILAHINGQVPDIRNVRPDLGQEIAEVITKSLAKHPDDRFQSAGDFAEALSAAIHKNDDTLADIKKEFPISANNQSANRLPYDNPTIKLSRDETEILAGNSTQVLDSQAVQQPTQVIVRDSINPFVLMGGFGLIAVVIVVIAVLLINNTGSETPLIPTIDPNAVVDNTEVPTDVPVVIPSVPTFGEVRYSTENSFGDRVEVRLSGAAPTQGDTSYMAWLTNTETDETLLIGRVIVDGLGDGTATFTDEDGRMLAANYNAVLVTLEDGDTDSPSGEIAYSATLPISVSNGLTEIFVTSERGLGGDGSLLDGAQTEARFAAQHAGLAAGAGNIGGVRTHAEHTINILTGEQLDRDNSGSGSNPGRGVGVYFFLEAINSILNEASSGENTSIDLQTNAEFIRVCTQNVQLWADEIIELEFEMIAGESLEAIVEQTERSTLLAEQLRSGFDLNENGIIEAFEGECGLDQIPNFGLQFARMDIVEGDVTVSESE